MELHTLFLTVSDLYCHNCSLCTGIYSSPNAMYDAVLDKAHLWCEYGNIWYLLSGIKCMDLIKFIRIEITNL